MLKGMINFGSEDDVLKFTEMLKIENEALMKKNQVLESGSAALDDIITAVKSENRELKNIVQASQSGNSDNRMLRSQNDLLSKTIDDTVKRVARLEQEALDLKEENQVLREQKEEAAKSRLSEPSAKRLRPLGYGTHVSTADLENQVQTLEASNVSLLEKCQRLEESLFLVSGGREGCTPQDSGSLISHWIASVTKLEEDVSRLNKEKDDMANDLTAVNNEKETEGRNFQRFNELCCILANLLCENMPSDSCKATLTEGTMEERILAVRKVCNHVVETSTNLKSRIAEVSKEYDSLREMVPEVKRRMGDKNQQILSLERQVASLQQELKEAADSIEAKDAKIDDLEQQETSNEANSNARAEEELSYLRSELNKLHEVIRKKDDKIAAQQLKLFSMTPSGPQRNAAVNEQLLGQSARYSSGNLSKVNPPLPPVPPPPAEPQPPVPPPPPCPPNIQHAPTNSNSSMRMPKNYLYPPSFIANDPRTSGLAQQWKKLS